MKGSQIKKKGMAIMKKLIGLMLVLAMVMMCFATVLADGDSITISLKDPAPGTEAGETLVGYKIFDVTKTEGIDAANDNSENTGFAYSIAANSPWLSVVEGLKEGEIPYFTLVPASDGQSYAVTLNESVSISEDVAKNIASKLLASKPSNASSISVATGEPVEADPGYYLFTSPLGENLVLATTNIEITEKNDYPTVTKEDDKDDDTASIGDDVVYTIEITVPEKANNIITVNDTMSDGLSFKGNSLKSVTIKGAEGSTVPEHADDTPGYTFTNGTDGFTVVFDADCVKANQGKTIVIEYTATLNENAVVGAVDDEDGNRNDVKITYSNYSMTDYEPLETYKYEVVKVKADNKTLTGAEFTLWNDADSIDEANKIGVVATNTTGVYRIAAYGETPITGNMVTDGNGKLTIIGLGSGSYYLQEEVEPDGYNKLGHRHNFTITDADKPATVEEGECKDGDKIVNQTGTELPSTGGMGTTLFYVIGGLLIIGAAVVLVARRKAHE